MVRKICVVLLCMALFSIVAPPVFGAEGASDDAKAKNNMFLALGIGIGLGIAVIGGALGQGKAIAASVESMARQPEAAGKIQTAMIIGLALIETLVIYMLLIAFVLGGNFAKLG